MKVSGRDKESYCKRKHLLSEIMNPPPGSLYCGNDFTESHSCSMLAWLT